MCGKTLHPTINHPNDFYTKQGELRAEFEAVRKNYRPVVFSVSDRARFSAGFWLWVLGFFCFGLASLEIFSSGFGVYSIFLTIMGITAIVLDCIIIIAFIIKQKSEKFDNAPVYLVLLNDHSGSAGEKFVAFLYLMPIITLTTGARKEKLSVSFYEGFDLVQTKLSFPNGTVSGLQTGTNLFFAVKTGKEKKPLQFVKMVRRKVK